MISHKVRATHSRQGDILYISQVTNTPQKIHIPSFRAEGVTSISPPTGLKAASWVATSVSKASGLWRPAGFPPGLSILWRGSCSSNTAISYKQTQQHPLQLQWTHRSPGYCIWLRSLVSMKMASENLKC